MCLHNKVTRAWGDVGIQNSRKKGRDACIGAGPGENNRKAKKTLGNGESKGDRQIKQLASSYGHQWELVLWLWLGLARSTQMHAEIADDADAALCHLFFLYARIVFYTIMYNTTYIFFLFPLFTDSLHSIMVLTGVDRSRSLASLNYELVHWF